MILCSFGSIFSPGVRDRVMHALVTRDLLFWGLSRGKCVVLTSSKVLLQHMEAMALQLQPCVVVSLERMRSGAIADLSAKAS